MDAERALRAPGGGEGVGSGHRRGGHPWDSIDAAAPGSAASGSATSSDWAAPDEDARAVTSL